MSVSLTRSRTQAKAAGLKWYFTGRPCPHGHVGERATSNGGCRECLRGQIRGWRKARSDHVKAYQRAYDVANADRARELEIEWRKKNAPRLTAQRQQYRLENAERRALHERARRARKANADGSHTLEDVQAILAAQRNRCAYCRKPLKGKYHVDHIMPLVLGGSDDKSNLQCCCPACNVSKGTRSPERFARIRGLLL